MIFITYEILLLPLGVAPYLNSPSLTTAALEFVARLPKESGSFCRAGAAGTRPDFSTNATSPINTLPIPDSYTSLYVRSFRR